MAPHEEAAIGQRCIIREACARSQPPSAWRRRPPPRLRHGNRALPLPPARRINKNFCKSGLPQNHMPRPRQIKDLRLGEDLKGAKEIVVFYSLEGLWIVVKKHNFLNLLKIKYFS
jgi:hypothetical protein